MPSFILLAATLASLAAAAPPPAPSAPPDPAAAPALAGCFAPDTPMARVMELQERFGLGADLLAPGVMTPKHRLSTRWSGTATNPAPLAMGDPTTITWSYLPDGTSIGGFVGEPTSASNLFLWMNALYPGGFAEWHPLFVGMFARWGELTGNTYVYQPTDDGAPLPGSPGLLGVRGDVRIGAHTIDGNGGILAYNFYPDVGEMVLDSFDSFYANKSGGSLRLRNVLAHEHGHGLGLAHVCPVNSTKLMEPFASTAFDGPQHDDILGGNRGYGDANEHDDTPTAAVDLGNAYPPGVAEPLMSIDGDTDADFYQVAGLTPDAENGGEVLVTVDPNGLTYLEGPQSGGCSAGTSFNSEVIRDLGIEILDSDGATGLGLANAFGPGGTETLAVPVPAADAGPFYVRVFGSAASNAQLYDLSVRVTAIPVARPGGPYAAECQGATTVLPLSGSASFDPDGGTVTHAWTTDCPGGTLDAPSSAAPVLSVSPGFEACDVTCSVTLTVTDDEGRQDSTAASVTIGDDTPPATIACPPDITIVSAPGDPPCEAIVNVGVATGTDACDPVLDAGSDAPAAFPRGRTTVTHFVADECGLTRTCTQDVTVYGRFTCFAANCSKIQPGTGNGDGKITAQGTFTSCDGTGVYSERTADDRVRIIVDGFVAFDQPWSAFTGSGTSWRYHVGAVAVGLRDHQWKFVDRASNVTPADLTPADGVDHELHVGFNAGLETLPMRVNRGDLDACRHGQSAIDCP